MDGQTHKKRWHRIIIHADMDAFYAAVEQLDNPELRGKPVLVGGLGKRSVVSTASYEARPYGVGSAMSMVRARSLCREAIVVPPRFARYKEVSGQIMEVFSNMSPHVEPLSLDEAFVDMTGAEGLFGSPRLMGRKIKEDVLAATGGLTISVGIATTKFVAKVASDFQKPDGLTIVEPGGETVFLFPLGIQRLWGVGPKTLERLQRLGLKTIGEVAKTDEAFLLGRLGSLGTHIWNLARGFDDRPVEGERGAKSIGAERTLDEDIRGERAINGQLGHLSEKVGRALRRKGLVASGVRVKLKTADFRLMTRQIKLPRPTDVTLEIAEKARGLLHQFDLSLPMRLVGLAVYHLDDRSFLEQTELFPDQNHERQRNLDKTLDLLRNKFGDDVVKRGGTGG